MIPTAATILDEHLSTTTVRNYIFETADGKPAVLDYVVREVIRPVATNLHELGIADIVIQAILRHSNVSVTRGSYVLNDAVDPRSRAAMEALESAVCNQNATGAHGTEQRTDVKH